MVGAQLLSGRYRIEERLGRGGMGVVFAARDERLGRRVAVKLLDEALADDPRFVERFRQEARAVAVLAHPHLANIFDYGVDGGRHYIVMELVEGRDLARLLREEGPPSLERAVSIAVQMCDALGHAHASGIVHRDIKPANLIVGPADFVKVTDFGIARTHGQPALTAAGSLLGTVQYIAPEQVSGGAVGPACDVYSAGIVLYEVLTGSAPFAGDSPISLALEHVSKDVGRPSDINPLVPPELDYVVARATAKDPRARYSDGNDMAAALRASAQPMEVRGEPAAVPTAPLASGSTTATGRSTARFWDALWPQRADWSSAVRAVLIATFLVLALVAAGLAASTAIRSAGTGARRERGSGPVRTTEHASVHRVGGNVRASADVLSIAT